MCRGQRIPTYTRAGAHWRETKNARLPPSAAAADHDVIHFCHSASQVSPSLLPANAINSVPRPARWAVASSYFWQHATFIFVVFLYQCIYNCDFVASVL